MFFAEYCKQKQTNKVIIILYPIYIEDSDCSKVEMIAPASLHANYIVRRKMVAILYFLNCLLWARNGYMIADYLTMKKDQCPRILTERWS